MKYLLFLIIALHFCFQSFSQSLQGDSVSSKKSTQGLENVFLGFGSGQIINYVLDKQVSPLTYRGFGIGGYTSLLIRLPKKISRHDVRFARTFYTNKFHKETESGWAVGSGLKYNTGSYFLATKIFHEKVMVFLGYCGNVQFNFRRNPRFSNSSVSYDMFLNVGPAIHLERDISWKEKDYRIWFLKVHRKERSLRFAWQLELPVVHLITRPNYTTILHAAHGDQHVFDGLIDNLDLTSFNNFFMVSSRVELYYRLHNNNNMLRLSYLWQAYSYSKRYYEVQDVFSGLFISYIFKFDKNKNY